MSTSSPSPSSPSADGDELPPLDDKDSKRQWSRDRLHLEDTQIEILFLMELFALGALVRPILGRCWKWSRRCSQFLEARHLKRRGYWDLWEQRHNTDTDMEVALEWNFMMLIGSMVKALLLLLYSIIEVIATKVPAAVHYGNCQMGGVWFPDGAIDFISSSTESDLSFTASFVEKVYNSTLGASQLGYHTADGRFGVCEVPARVVATLNQSTEIQALAWTASGVGILMCAYAYLLYSCSGSLLVLFQQVRLKAVLPSFALIKRYYRTSKPLVRLCYFSMVCLAVGLAISVFVPTIPYRTQACPVPEGYSSGSGRLKCIYGFPDISTQWGVYLACLLTMYSTWDMIDSFSNILNLLADPFSGMPANAIFLNDAMQKELKRRKDKEDGVVAAVTSDEKQEPELRSILDSSSPQAAAGSAIDHDLSKGATISAIPTADHHWQTVLNLSTLYVGQAGELVDKKQEMQRTTFRTRFTRDFNIIWSWLGKCFRCPWCRPSQVDAVEKLGPPPSGEAPSWVLALTKHDSTAPRAALWPANFANRDTTKRGIFGRVWNRFLMAVMVALMPIGCAWIAVLTVALLVTRP